eukprot:c3263_g2_i1 orf=2-181(-)
MLDLWLILLYFVAHHEETSFNVLATFVRKRSYTTIVNTSVPCWPTNWPVPLFLVVSLSLS